MNSSLLIQQFYKKKRKTLKKIEKYFIEMSKKKEIVFVTFLDHICN